MAPPTSPILGPVTNYAPTPLASLDFWRSPTAQAPAAAQNNPTVAQSADGVMHQFPAGTDQTVIDRVMKEYATSKQATQGKPGMFDDPIPNKSPPSGGGMFDDLIPAKPQPSAMVQDPFGMFGRQMINTALFGIPEKVGAGVQGLIRGGVVDPVMGRGFNVGDRYNQALAQERTDQAAFAQEHPVASAAATGAGLVYGAKALPAIGSGVSGLVKSGAAYGAAAGAAGDANSVQERAYNTLAGGAGGAAVAGLLGVGAAGLGKAMVPYSVPGENAAAVNTLKANGVDLTAGQMTGNRGLLYREAELGGNKAQAFTDNQAQQFTKAVLSKVGENASAATPEVVDRAFTRIGGMFDNLAAKSSAVNDSQLSRDVIGTLNDYASKTSQANTVPYIRDVAKDILTRDNISGDWYQNVRSKLGEFARSADPQAADAAY